MGAPLGWAAAQQLRLGARRSGAGQEDGGGLGQEEGRRHRSHPTRQSLTETTIDGRLSISGGIILETENPFLGRMGKIQGRRNFPENTNNFLIMPHKCF